MFESEFMKSMNCNYERVKLAEKPEERRYQYCIVNRGGIKGLLPCSLRYINGDAFLYYDITSKQSVSQLFHKRAIDRKWVKDFMWNLKHIQQEMGRFLLDEGNIIWYPNQVYQDLEDSRMSFLYFPYYDGDNGFKQLLEFIVERMDYKDDQLVECVYKMYEQFDSFGSVYLKEKIFQDALSLAAEPTAEVLEENKPFVDVRDTIEVKEEKSLEEVWKEELYIEEKADSFTKPKNKNKERKGLLSFLEGARKKDKDISDKYINRRNRLYTEDEPAVAAENHDYYDSDSLQPKEEYGKTVYIENIAEQVDTTRRLYNSEEQVVATLTRDSIVIGKKKEDADVVIDNSTVSRIHARITYENEEYYLEDLNSTNGTSKNGLRLRPYEKRKISVGDDIRIGNVTLTFR